MKRYFLMIPLFAFAIVLGGCEQLSMVFSGAQEQIVRGVNTYCSTVSQAERQIIRSYVNENSPHTVRVDCAGDEP